MSVPIAPIIESLSAEVARKGRTVSNTGHITDLSMAGSIAGIAEALVTEVAAVTLV